MKKIYLFFLTTTLVLNVFSQRLSKITISGNGNTSVFSFLLNENVVLNISQEGGIAEWGVDRYAGRPIDYIQRKLEVFGGRVEYYNEKDDSAFRGKIKFIGSTQIKYFASYDRTELIGKLKSVGSINLDYYTKIDDAMLANKVKSIGSANINYYSSFENAAIKGKIKSYGSISMTYYNSMEDKAFVGKLKTMGNSNFTYYGSQERTYTPGSVKLGNQIQVLNGVTFFINNY
jgi:hypothetical protein